MKELIRARIKELRKGLGLTQENFAEKLNITRANLSSIETGRVNVTERMIQNICVTFHANVIWLKTGLGNMLQEQQPVEDQYIRATAELSKQGDVFSQQFLLTYWMLNDENKKLLQEFLINLVKNIEKADKNN